ECAGHLIELQICAGVVRARIYVEELGRVEQRRERARDRLLDRLGRDPVLLVERLLLRPAAVGLLYRSLHRARDRVGVEDDAALDVSRRAADRLDERGAVPEVAF